MDRLSTHQSSNQSLPSFQGYHDICVTSLLAVGEDLAFALMNSLSTHHSFIQSINQSLPQFAGLPRHMRYLPTGRRGGFGFRSDGSSFHSSSSGFHGFNDGENDASPQLSLSFGRPRQPGTTRLRGVRASCRNDVKWNSSSTTGCHSLVCFARSLAHSIPTNGKAGLLKGMPVDFVLFQRPQTYSSLRPKTLSHELGSERASKGANEKAQRSACAKQAVRNIANL